MALSWTTTLRDQICYLVFQRAYSALRADEKAILDNTEGSMPATTTGGHAGRSLTTVRQAAQWFEQGGAGSTTGPDVWDTVLVCEIVARMLQTLKPGEAKAAWAESARAWESALNTYTVADAAVTTLNHLTITQAMIRFHVINHTARRRPRLFPPVQDIDFALKWAVNFLWNKSKWRFRTRQATIAIATANDGSAPTITLPSGESFDQMATLALHYTDAAGIGQTIRGANAEEMTALRARYGTNSGRPERFRIEARNESTKYWHFIPVPDRAYTTRAEVLIATPADPSSSTDAAPFQKFPAEFRTLFPDLVLAKVMRQHNVTGWQDAWRLAMDQVDVTANEYESTGAPEIEALPERDVYFDRCATLGDPWGRQGL